MPHFDSAVQCHSQSFEKFSEIHPAVCCIEDECLASVWQHLGLDQLHLKLMLFYTLPNNLEEFLLVRLVALELLHVEDTLCLKLQNQIVSTARTMILGSTNEPFATVLVSPYFLSNILSEILNLINSFSIMEFSSTIFGNSTAEAIKSGWQYEHWRFYENAVCRQPLHSCAAVAGIK